MSIAQLKLAPALIDQVHDRLLAAIIDGTLAPGHRLTQDGIAEMLGVSRQPVSHALQVLKRRGLLVEADRRGVAVAPIDGSRILGLYQVREALEGLASELAAARVRTGKLPAQDVRELQAALEAGAGLPEDAPVLEFMEADVAFHSVILRLSGNPAIAETVAEQWPHFKRSMGVALASPSMRRRVWKEHAGIVGAIVEGEAAEAGRLARQHTARAGQETAWRLEEIDSARQGAQQGKQGERA